MKNECVRSCYALMLMPIENQPLFFCQSVPPFFVSIVRLYFLSHFLSLMTRSSLVRSSVRLFSFPLHTAEKALERDKFMSPEEAKDFGLIDRVLSHPPSMEQPSTADDKTDS